MQPAFGKFLVNHVVSPIVPTARVPVLDGVLLLGQWHILDFVSKHSLVGYLAAHAQHAPP
jgi:hypothetical protein